MAHDESLTLRLLRRIDPRLYGIVRGKYGAERDPERDSWDALSAEITVFLRSPGHGTWSG
jgi:hypothetical protein